ncbi:MAG: DNA-directed RNA polymerase subunit alpha [Candidatus Hydrogenedentes bacterium ADurb.Bin101]|nr:MAG: DNA-directed RNA polymerase subunit alpha [Candidatus Hydrogenedentes bacterium ADurb.Bin101]
MSEKDFSIPKMYKIEEGATDRYARVVAEPFERGYGTTTGNALRRVLLSALPGSAVTAIRFEDVLHEFSAIPGVYEDATDVVLNLKQCRIRLNEGESLIFTFTHKGEGAVTAGDLFAGQPIDVFNPDLVVFTATQSKTTVQMEIKVAKGRGFVTADKFEFEHAPLGTIYLDASFSPVTKVNFMIEDARVGQMTDYDRLILEVWTDGSITPEEALRNSAALLIKHFNIFTLSSSDRVFEAEDGFAENQELMRVLSRSIDELELGARAANCLKAARIATIGQMVALSETELMDLPNFGKKSLDEIKAILEAQKLHLDMKMPGMDKGPVREEHDEDSDDDSNHAGDIEEEDELDEENTDEDE